MSYFSYKKDELPEYIKREIKDIEKHMEYHDKFRRRDEKGRFVPLEAR